MERSRDDLDLLDVHGANPRDPSGRLGSIQRGQACDRAGENHASFADLNSQLTFGESGIASEVPRDILLNLLVRSAGARNHSDFIPDFSGSRDSSDC